MYSRSVVCRTVGGTGGYEVVEEEEKEVGEVEVLLLNIEER